MQYLFYSEIDNYIYNCYRAINWDRTMSEQKKKQS